MKFKLDQGGNLENIFLSNVSEYKHGGKIIAQYELLKRVLHREGTIVSCGVLAENEEDCFNAIRKLEILSTTKKVIAFEKLIKTLYLHNGCLEYKTHIPEYRQVLVDTIIKKAANNRIELIPGCPEDSISNYLIENPELKISFLNISFDDYESTFTTLEFLYPRVVQGGIIVFDNYYKKGEEFKAARDYLTNFKVDINKFSINKGPDYIIKK